MEDPGEGKVYEHNALEISYAFIKQRLEEIIHTFRSSNISFAPCLASCRQGERVVCCLSVPETGRPPFKTEVLSSSNLSLLAEWVMFWRHELLTEHLTSGDEKNPPSGTKDPIKLLRYHGHESVSLWETRDQMSKQTAKLSKTWHYRSVNIE